MSRQRPSKLGRRQVTEGASEVGAPGVGGGCRGLEMSVGSIGSQALTGGTRLSQLRALDLQADEKGPSQIKLR